MKSNLPLQILDVKSYSSNNIRNRLTTFTVTISVPNRAHQSDIERTKCGENIYGRKSAPHTNYIWKKARKKCCNKKQQCVGGGCGGHVVPVFCVLAVGKKGTTFER